MSGPAIIDLTVNGPANNWGSSGGGQQNQGANQNLEYKYHSTNGSWDRYRLVYPGTSTPASNVSWAAAVDIHDIEVDFTSNANYYVVADGGSNAPAYLEVYPAGSTPTSNPTNTQVNVSAGDTLYIYDGTNVNSWVETDLTFTAATITVTDLEWDTHVDGGQTWHGTFLTTGTVSNTDLTISNEAGTLASSDVFVQSAQFANNAGGYDPGYRFRIVPNGTTMYMCEVGTEFAWGHVVDTTHNPTPLSNASISIPSATSITASTDDGSGNVTQLVLTEQQRNAQNVVWTAPSGHLFGPLEFWLTTSLSDAVNYSSYAVGTPIAHLKIFEENATGSSRIGSNVVFVLGAQTTMTHTWQPYLPSLESVTMSCTDWNPLNTNNNNNNSSSRRRRGHCFW